MTLKDAFENNLIKQFDRLLVGTVSPNLGVEYKFIEIEIQSIIQSEVGKLVKYKVLSGENYGKFIWRNPEEFKLDEILVSILNKSEEKMLCS
jgi:hypothetical protein